MNWVSSNSKFCSEKDTAKRIKGKLQIWKEYLHTTYPAIETEDLYPK